MDTALAKPLSLGTAQALLTTAGIPPSEVSSLFGHGSEPRGTAARPVCALAAAGGRLCAWNQISLSDAIALFDKVTGLVERGAINTREWFNHMRQDSDFAMERDFINFQRAFGTSGNPQVQAILDRFKTAVATQIGNPSFDIYADALGEKQVGLREASFSVRKPK